MSTKQYKEIFADETTGMPERTPTVPTHRFEYIDTDEDAEFDKGLYEAWCEGLLSTKRALTRLVLQNAYEFATKKDFIENANWLGYFRTRRTAELVEGMVASADEMVAFTEGNVYAG